LKDTIRLRQLKEAIQSYQYPMPFQEHLHNFFTKNKNMGSKDRKELRQLAYSYLRIGKSLRYHDFDKRAVIADFLCNSEPILTQNAFKESYKQTVEEKLEVINDKYPDFNKEDIFPYTDDISGRIDSDALMDSFLKQPFVWIKVTAGKENELEQELLAAKIPFEKHQELTWKFSPEVKLSELEGFTKGHFRIQDLSTQTTSEYFKAKKDELWWDCCAGAGGKSLALLDTQPDVQLYASDLRETILQNLRERLELYNYAATKVFKSNVEASSPKHLPLMDGIIADVPCSGSGTWSRNPEHLTWFQKTQLKDYSARQLKILQHAYPALKPGKPLIYITCSVFAEENEKVVQAFSGKHAVKIELEKYIEGFRNGAENIYICRMIKTEGRKA
jgi:16S rRNA (cytosine967-C5)-methyltransferase